MRELPHSTEPSPEFGSDDIRVIASTALRSTNWEIRQASGDDSKEQQAQTNYKVDSSILREYKVQATVYDTDFAVMYLKNEARQELGETAYSGIERINAYIGFNGIFEKGRLIAEYRHESAGGLAYISDPNSPKTTPTPFINKYEQLTIAQQRNTGMYWGLSFSRNNMPMSIHLDSGSGQGETLFDPDVQLLKTSVVAGGSSTNYKLNNMRYFNGLYSSLRVGFGAFSYKLSPSVAQDAEAVIGDIPGYAEGLSLEAQTEIGWAVHNRFSKINDLGFALEVGFSFEADFYDSLSGSVRDPNTDAQISFRRTDYRFGPIVRLTGVF